MNVVDTSAVVAVLLGEPGSEEIEQKLMGEPCIMSAATRVELGIVVEAKTGAAGTLLLNELLARIGVQIAPVDEGFADEALACWRRFGKGRHTAALNFGDVFSYALARRLGHPLVCVGNDFAQTDVQIG